MWHGICSLPLLMSVRLITVVFCFFVAVATIQADSTQPIGNEVTKSTSLVADPDQRIASMEEVKHSSVAVPEPSRMVLLILGTLLVGFAYRRAWVGMRDATSRNQ